MLPRAPKRLSRDFALERGMPPLSSVVDYLCVNMWDATLRRTFPLVAGVGWLSSGNGGEPCDRGAVRVPPWA
jgi:hypothetical protein